MNTLYIGIIAAIAIFFGIQTIAPFPYGLVIGIVVAGLIIWRTAKSVSWNHDSLLHYRRVDPLTDKERKQNKEAFRIIKKDFLEGKISEEEYKKKKKEFDIED
jgi:hypothetical protein